MEDTRPGNLKEKAASTFPFDQLTLQIQVMIAKESVLSATPVAVGRPPGSLSRPGGYAGGILRTCCAFDRADICKIFYENNAFELMNSDWTKFFQHHRKHHIQRLILRTDTIPNWRLDMLWMIENLRSLENLQDVGIRVDGRWHDLWLTDGSPLKPIHLKQFLQIMCRVCKNLRVIEILINHAHAKDMMAEWSQFLKSTLNPHMVWPAGIPDEQRAITFMVS